MVENGSKMLLPVEAYTSQQWFEREQRQLFGKVWQFAGMASDIPDAGSCLCVNLGACPVIVVRDEEGGLRAFHNICRHRGTQLLEVAGKRRKVIQCPYHDWVYSLDGKLIGVPERSSQFPHIDMAELGLFPASVVTWKGMIFVNPDAGGMSFEDWLGDFPQHFGPHQPESLRESDVRQYEVRANWKVFVENYIDVYHLSHLHSETLNMYDHARLESAVCGAGHVATWDPPAREYQKYLESSSNGLMPPLFSDPQKWGVHTHMMFPNFGVVGTEYFWSTLEVVPLAPALTTVRTRTRTALDGIGLALVTASEKVDAWRAQIAGYRRGDNPLESGDFMLEDIYACEQQQKAMNSPRFTFGPTSLDKEQLIVDFQRALLSHIGR